MPITMFVWKVASRCNLDCSYCYVYQGEDQSWRRQPRYMSVAVAEAAAARILDYCRQSSLPSVNINFHGGEPLLAGTERLQALVAAIEAIFADSGIEVRSALQSNGLLVKPSALKWLAEHGIGLYLSLDGPPQVNDRQRVDRKGRAVTHLIERRITDLLSSEYRRIFQGFLSVVDPSFPARETFDYLAGFKPPAIDFLLPLQNHDNFEQRDYDRWLIDCFDHWFDGGSGIRVRYFERIIAGLLLARSPHGNATVNALVVETDGTYEIEDTLKTAYGGACGLDLNVFEHTLSDVLHSAAFLRFFRDLTPASDCQRCEFVGSCNGGHISHRYSRARRYDNPSVYCEHIKALTRHISARLADELRNRRQRAN